MNAKPPPAGLEIEDVPVEGPDVPDLEDLPDDYVPPEYTRDYPRANDATDEGGDDE